MQKRDDPVPASSVERMNAGNIRDYIERNTLQRYMVFGGMVDRYLKNEGMELLMKDGSPVPQSIVSALPKRPVSLWLFSMVKK